MEKTLVAQVHHFGGGKRGLPPWGGSVCLWASLADAADAHRRLAHAPGDWGYPTGAALTPSHRWETGRAWTETSAAGALAELRARIAGRWPETAWVTAASVQAEARRRTAAEVAAAEAVALAALQAEGWSVAPQVGAAWSALAVTAEGLALDVRRTRNRDRWAASVGDHCPEEGNGPVEAVRRALAEAARRAAVEAATAQVPETLRGLVPTYSEAVWPPGVVVRAAPGDWSEDWLLLARCWQTRRGACALREVPPQARRLLRTGSVPRLDARGRQTGEVIAGFVLVGEDDPVDVAFTALQVAEARP